MITSVDNIGEQVAVTAVHFDDDILHVSLSDGRTITVPLDSVEWLQWLARASPEQRANWSIEPRGFAVYWEDLDNGFEIVHLLGMQPLS